jgi:preprotein translocase subunit YajC
MKRFWKFAPVIGVLLALLVFAGGCFPAATTTTPGGEPVEPTFFEQYGIFIFLVVIFALFYLVMIRPQRKRQKAQQEMTQNLQKGDEVVTAGGIFGKIDSLADDSVVVKIESGGTIRVARGSVAVRQPRPDYKIK